MRGWGRDGLGTGRRGEGAEGVRVAFAPNNGASSGDFTAEVTSQAGNTIGGTFTVDSRGSTTRVPFSVTITPSGDFLSTTVSFTVFSLGIPIGSGTATLTGQITGDTITANFSGQLQGLENCNVTGSGTGTRI